MPSGKRRALGDMQASTRLHHLDFLRAALMFLGVLVHASHADYDLSQFGWVRFFSGSFRMACFFLISGYFAPQLLAKGSTLEFLKKRLVTLGVPALFCVFVLNPPALAAIGAYYETAPSPAKHAVNWHLHVWFLFALSLYALVSRPLLTAVRAICQPRSHTRGYALQTLFMLGLICACAIGRKALEKWGPSLPGYSAYEEILEPAVQDLPYFAFGILMRESPVAFRFAHERTKTWFLAAIGMLAVRHASEQQPIITTAQHLIHLSIDFATAFACSFALLGAVQRLVTEPRRWVRLTSESAYTVYIVHYCLIAECLLGGQRSGLSVWERASSAAVLSLAGGLAIHFLMVRRFPLAAFLLNGRPLRRPEAQPLLAEAAEPPSRPSRTPTEPTRTEPISGVLAPDGTSAERSGTKTA
jgi:glucan biosynthesis protein C